MLTSPRKRGEERRASAAPPGQSGRCWLATAMLRKIYDWCIDAAERPYALWILGAVSFMESSFLPVPPDIMLIPMSLARPERAWRFAAVCTLTSVAGGMLGATLAWIAAQARAHMKAKILYVEPDSARSPS